MFLQISVQVREHNLYTSEESQHASNKDTCRHEQETAVNSLSHRSLTIIIHKSATTAWGQVHWYLY